MSEYRRGDYDAAIKLLQQSIGTHSAMEQSAYLFLGQAYLKRGDNNSALMAFENAYRVDYDREVRETAFYNYAVARMDGGRVPFGNSVALLENFLRGISQLNLQRRRAALYRQWLHVRQRL